MVVVDRGGEKFVSEVDEGEVGALGGVEKSCGGAEWVQYRSQMNALELYHTPAIFFYLFSDEIASSDWLFVAFLCEFSTRYL